MSARGAAPPRLRSAYDQVDLGFAQAALGDDAAFSLTRSCVVALSGDGLYLALGCGELLLLLPQGSSTAPPRTLRTRDAVRSLCWHGLDVLLAGSASGQLLAFALDGVLLWSEHLHASPLVHLAPQPLPPRMGSADGNEEPNLVCLFEGGMVACARLVPPVRSYRCDGRRRQHHPHVVAH